MPKQFVIHEIRKIINIPNYKKKYIQKLLSDNFQPKDELGQLIRDIARSAFELGFEQAIVNKSSSQEGSVEFARAQSKIDADNRAVLLAPLIEEFESNGIKSLRAIAEALNNRQKLTRSGKPWSGKTVMELKQRIEDLKKEGKFTLKVDEQLVEIIPIIEELRKNEINKPLEVATALNDRNIPTKNGGKWNHDNVKAILNKIDQLSNLSTDRAIAL